MEDFDYLGYKPNPLTDGERSTLLGRVLIGDIPDALTPPEAVELAYPDRENKDEREALLSAICRALKSGELLTAIPVRALPELNPAVAARWRGAELPFNPRHFQFLGDTSPDGGFAVPDYSIPIRLQDLMSWVARKKITLGRGSRLSAREAILRARRSAFGKSAHTSRPRIDWRPLVEAGKKLMNGGDSASDAARKVGKENNLSGSDKTKLSGQVKTLASKLTEGNATANRKRKN